MFQLSQQSQGFFGIIRTGFLIWKSTLKVTLPISLALAIANAIFQLIGHWLGAGGELANIGTQHPLMEASSAEAEITMAPTMFFTIIITSLMTLVLDIALLYRIDRAVHHQDTTFTGALKIGFRRAIGTCVTSALAFIVLFIGFIPLVVPGINHYLFSSLHENLAYLLLLLPGAMLYLYVFFAPLIYITSGSGVIESLSLSYHLVRGRWGYTALVLLGIFILFLLFAFILGFSFGMMGGFLSGVFKQVLGHPESVKEYILFIVDGILVLILYPLAASFMLTLLYELQNRKKLEDKYPSVQI